MLKTLIELGTTAHDFANACPDGLGVERGHRDLPRRRGHQLRRGEQAFADINCTLGGRFLVEGRSWVVRHLGEDRYLVRFPDGELIERFVDPKAQADPYAYVRTLNNKEAA